MVARPTDPLPSWRETPTKQSIMDFVAAVTAPDSDAAVPEVDRVAVFDNDAHARVLTCPPCINRCSNY